MFSHLSLSHSVHRHPQQTPLWADSPPRQAPPWTDTPLGRHLPGRHPRGETPGQTPPRQPLQRMVRILLECFLVQFKCVLTILLQSSFPTKHKVRNFGNFIFVLFLGRAK